MASEGGDYVGPQTVDDLVTMDWAEFEAFALQIIKAEYKLHNIDLQVTGRGADGGRDGEVQIRLGDDLLGATFIFWIEVKRRRENVGIKHGGPHLPQALVAGANLLVFISASDFTRGFTALCEEFEARTGLKHRFISAKRLLTLAQKHKIASSRNTMPSSEQASEPGAHNLENETPVCEPAISVEVAHFSLSRRLNFSQHLPTLSVADGIPAFLVLRVRLSGCPILSRIELSIEHSLSNFVFDTVGAVKHRVVSETDVFTAMFVVVSKNDEAACSLVDLTVAAHVEAPYVSEETKTTWCVRCTLSEVPNAEQELRFFRPILPHVETRSQALVSDQLKAYVKRWRQEGGVATFTLLAAAGMGKSRLLERVRLHWIAEPIVEIQLDGAVDTRISKIFYSVFSNLFPVDTDLVRRIGESGLENWFLGAGTAPITAKQLARKICAGCELDEAATSGELANLMAVLVAQSANARPTIINFEDLHKVGGDVLRFLQSVRTALVESGSHALFIFSSRFDPELDDATAEWRAERQRLIEGEKNLTSRIEPPAPMEARAILNRGFFNLYPEHADAMIERSGVSPFELAELVHFLDASGVIARKDESGAWRVNDAQSLRNALRDARLLASSPTFERLALTRRHLPTWATNALDVAACLGREFELGTVLSVARSPADVISVDATLSRLARDDVWRPVSRGAELHWRFSHDLIHEAVLTNLCSLDRTAERLRVVEQLRTCGTVWSRPIDLGLTYIGGMGEEFVKKADNYADALLKNGYPYEASQILMLEDHVLEQDVFPPTIDDPLYRVAPLPGLAHIDAGTDDYERRIQAKRRRVEALSDISGGAGGAMASLISDVTMLARKRGDRSTLALTFLWQGTYHIQTGEIESAEFAFKQSETQYRALDNPPRKDVFDATLGRAIAMRLLGRDKALEALEEACQLAGNDPDMLVRYHANYGALHMYSSPSLRRKHWEAACVIAQENELRDKHVHMRLDLASLDIIEERYDRARTELPELIEESSRRRYEGSLTRALIMEAALYLVAECPEAAMTSLDQARRLGFLHETGRRMWKIHANSALAHEMMGCFDLMADEDRLVLEASQHVGWERRNALAPANILLRAHDTNTPVSLDDVIALLPSETFAAAEKIIEAVNFGKPLIGMFPQEHLRTLCGRKRFLIV